MLSIGIGISGLINSYLAGRDSALKALDSLGPEVPDFGIVLSTYNYSIKNIITATRSTVGNRPLIGITTLGQILDRQEKKYSVLVALISTERAHFVAETIEGISKNPYTSGHHLAWQLLEELGKKLEGSEVPRKALIIFCDNTTIMHSEFLKGLQEVLGLKFPIVGALSCGENILRHGLQANNEKVISDSLSGILLAGTNLIIGVGARHGWQPLGLPQPVTKAVKNKIISIGNMVPYQFYKRYLADNINILENEPTIAFALFPLGIMIEKKRYLLRIPISLNSDGSLSFQTIVPEGTEVRLMIAYREQLLEATKQALEEALVPFRQRRLSPQFIMVFSSYLRKEILGIDLSQELAIIKRKLPEKVKVFGCYSFGEFGPLVGGDEIGTAYFQNGTIVILTIGTDK